MWMATCVALVVVATAAPAQGQSHAVRYTGELIATDASGDGVPVRSFAMHAMFPVASGGTLVFRVDDEHGGPGELRWWEQLGSLTLSADGLPTEGLPIVRYLHEGRTYEIPLPCPVVTKPLEIGAAWSDESGAEAIDWEVVDEDLIDGVECWELVGTTHVGRGLSLIVRKGDGIVSQAAQRVFIGQGEPFELQLALVHHEVLDGESLARQQVAGDSLLKARAIVTEGQTEVEHLNAESLAAVSQMLPGLQNAAAGTIWEQFVASLKVDLQTEGKRADSLAALAVAVVGHNLPELKLTTLVDGSTANIAQPGRVTVLHFYEYQGTPESPFGQVGYLDFLVGRAGDGVDVYGVAVDARFADAAQQGAVRRGVKAFSTQFMKLGYPVLIDDGAALAQLGDPRKLDTPLPLWIVIGKDGTVMHYHAGLYDIDPSRGLEELSAAVEAAR
jgi:hypothetical protein